MEEKPVQPKTPELPISEQEVQIQAPSLLDKIKIHKFKILSGILGVLVLAGAVFGAYKFGQIQQEKEQAQSRLERIELTQCEKNDDCVLAIRLGQCCVCPEAISREALKKDPDLVEYVEGKDYSQEKKVNCKDIICAPCASSPYAVCSEGKCQTKYQAVSDETANWKSYTNTKYGYSIKYPEEMSYRESKAKLPLPMLQTTDFTKRGGITEGEIPGVGVRVYGNEGLSPEAWFSKHSTAEAFEVSESPTIFYYKVTGKEEIDLNGNKGIRFVDNQITGAPSPTVIVSNQNLVVTIRGYYFVHDESLQGIVNLMLSTFKFLEEAPQPISIPNDWQEFTATDLDFGIKTTLSLPPGYSFRFTGSEFTIQNDADATELWDYSTSVVRKGDKYENSFKGGSRRAWYEDYLSGEYLEEKPVLFEEGKIEKAIEHSIGSTSYLELTASGGFNYVGEKEQHFIFEQNQIIHIIRPASHKANSPEAQIPKNIGIIFFSLRSSLIK